MSGIDYYFYSQKPQMKIGEMFSPNLRQMHSSKPQTEPFSFKKCLRWFKEYAGGFSFYANKNDMAKLYF